MTAHRDAVCLACGCLCDDLQIQVESNRITQIENACPAGERWWQFHDEHRPTAAAMIDHREAEFSNGINATADLLLKSKLPLFVGLRDLDVDGQRALCALADEVGGVVDSGLTFDALPTYFPNVGAMGCTWGEAIHRADLLVYWDCDPDELQPRHRERIVNRIATKRPVEIINACGDFTAIWTLRALIQRRPTNFEPASELVRLASQLLAARYAVVVHSSANPWTVALQALATDVNRTTRCRLMPLSGPGNETGATEVLTWQSGFPRSVAFHRGYPSATGSEYSANRLLDQGSVDCVMTFGGSSNELDVTARQRIAQMPHICVSIGVTVSASPAQIVLFASVPGIHAAGAVFRSDRVTLPLRPRLSTSFPRAALVLNQVLDTVRARRP